MRRVKCSRRIHGELGYSDIYSTLNFSSRNKRYKKYTKLREKGLSSFGTTQRGLALLCQGTAVVKSA
jgi:hypothetical protein